MNVLMTIAVVGATAIGQVEEAAAVVFLFSFGGWLEARALARTRTLDSRPDGACTENGPRRA